MHGKVEWFNRKYGYGFIKMDNGDSVYAHYSEIIGHSMLDDGEEVIFSKIIVDDNGLKRAAGITRVCNK